MPIFSKTLGNLEYNDPESFKALVNHIHVMQEELEYRLAHLDSENISEINMEDTNVFTSQGGLLQLLNKTDDSIAQLSIKDDEISASVEDLRNDTESSFTQTAEQIELSVQRSKDYTDGELKNYSTITQTADSIKTAVTESEARTVAGVDAKLEKYSTVEQTSAGIKTAVNDSKTYTDQETGKVTDSLKNYSTIEQTANSISSAVTESKTYTDGKTQELSSQITQTASDITLRVDGLEDDVGDLGTKIGHSLTLDKNGVYIVDTDGNMVTISGGQIDAASLNLSGNITFTNVANAAANAENTANGAAGAVYSLASGSYPGTFINGRNIYTPNFFSDAIILYDGNGNAIGTMTMKSVETDAFDLTSFGSIRMISAAGYNAYIGVNGGPSMLLHGGSDGLGPRCQIAGGALSVDGYSYGYSLPSTAVDGQVFFLLS